MLNTITLPIVLSILSKSVLIGTQTVKEHFVLQQQQHV